MNLREVLKNNVFYLDNIDTDDVGIIYHYTSAAGIKGIIEDGNFNVSHSMFMNDKTELIYTYKLTCDLLNERISISNDFNQKLLKVLLKSIDYELEFLCNPKAINIRASIDRIPNYILSFSLDKDSPHMWASFNCTNGYNIGINFSDLYSMIKKNSRYIIMSYYVIYDRSVQERTLNRIIDDFICSEDTMRETPKNDYMTEFVIRVNMVASFFKNPVFANDKEFRIMLSNHATSHYVKPRYRIRENCIIPYITAIDFYEDDKKILPIKSITAGPTNFSDIALEGICYFMFDYGYNIDNIEFIKSEIPIRY